MESGNLVKNRSNEGTFKNFFLVLADSVVCKSIFQIERTKYASVRVMPKFIKVETTNFCNAECKYCPHKYISRKKGFMDMKLFRKIIRDVAAVGIPEIHLTNFGEPLMDAAIFERIRFVKKIAPLTKTVIITNGFLLKENYIKNIFSSGLDEIQISFDGFSKKHYEKYRTPFKFEVIKKNILSLVDMKKKIGSDMRVQLNVVCGDDVSEEEIRKYRCVWGEQVDAISFQRIHNWSISKISNMKSSNLPCWDPFKYMTVAWTGDVLTCCLDYDGKIVVGNLKKESVKDVWFGRNFRKFRESILRSRQSVPLCKDCSAPLSYKYPYISFLRFMNNL